MLENCIININNTKDYDSKDIDAERLKTDEFLGDDSLDQKNNKLNNVKTVDLDNGYRPI